MNITIHKYPITGVVNKVMTYHGVRWLKAGPDPLGIPCVWAEVNPRQIERDVKLIRVGTGHGIPAGSVYVDSFVEGEYVWHIYAL